MVTRQRFLSVLALLCAPLPVLTADLRVPEDYASLQAAINAAETGDRVLAAAGVYAEQIDFLGKVISVESIAGAAQTVIDGEGAPGFVVTVRNAPGTMAGLRGFTITGGYGEIGSLGAGPGGGIRVEAAGLSIQDSVIEANVGGLGAGISVANGDLLVRDSRLANNAGVFGGAINVEAGTLLIENSDFIANSSSSSGGALNLNWGVVAEIGNSRFEGNRGESLGGALYAANTQLDLRDSIFVDNGVVEAGEHGGWILSTIGGGGVYVVSSQGRIKGNRMLDNVAAAGSGLYIAGSSDLDVINNLIAGNARECDCGIGGVYLNGASPTLINNTIADNGGFVGVFTTFNSFPSISNSVIIGHQQPTGGNGLIALSYSLFDAEPLAAVSLGVGNVLSSAPRLDAADDYTPLPGSPTIDAGSNSVLPVDVDQDLLGNARRVDDPATPDSGEGSAPMVDIGAVEFDPTGGSSHDAIFAHHFQPGG